MKTGGRNEVGNTKVDGEAGIAAKHISQKHTCISEFSAHVLEHLAWGANQRAVWAKCKECGLRSVLWKRHGTIGGGPSI